MNDDAKVNILPEEFVNSSVWKLAEFTNVVNDLFEKKYNIELNVTLNTLNNHFRKLEDQGIHFLNRINNVKICDQLDLEIAEFICVKRAKKLQKGIVWQLPQIYDEVGRKFECRKEEDVDILGNMNDSSDTVKLFNELEEKLIEIVERKVKERQDQLKIAMTESADSVKSSIVEYLDKQRIFKKEAAALWEEKPKSVRFSGLLIKTENMRDREKFIDEYVEDKMKEQFN